MNQPPAPPEQVRPDAAPTEASGRLGPAPMARVRMRGPSEDGGLKLIAATGIVGGFLGAGYWIYGDSLRKIPSESDVWDVVAVGMAGIEKSCSGNPPNFRLRLVADAAGEVANSSFPGGEWGECAGSQAQAWKFPELGGKNDFVVVEAQVSNGKLGDGQSWFLSAEWNIRNVESPLNKSEIQELLTENEVDALDCVFESVILKEGVPVSGQLRAIGANFDISPDGEATRIFVGDNAAIIEQGGANFAHNKPLFQNCLKGILTTTHWPSRASTDRANVMSAIEFDGRPLK